MKDWFLFSAVLFGTLVLRCSFCALYYICFIFKQTICLIELHKNIQRKISYPLTRPKRRKKLCVLCYYLYDIK